MVLVFFLVMCFFRRSFASLLLSNFFRIVFLQGVAQSLMEFLLSFGLFLVGNGFLFYLMLLGLFLGQGFLLVCRVGNNFFSCYDDSLSSLDLFQVLPVY